MPICHGRASSGAVARPGVKLWSETSYRYLKRQSEYDSGAWVAIEDSGRGQSQVGSLR